MPMEVVFDAAQSCMSLASSRPRPKLRTEQTKQQIQQSNDSPGSQS